MLSIKIEKEIKNEQKIVFGLTGRQIICVMCGVGIGVLIYALAGSDIFQLVPAFVILAVVFGAFGWLEKDGEHLEDFLIRRIKTIVYKNNNLRYRTSNSYVKLFNRGYMEIRKEETEKKKKEKRLVRPAKTNGAGRLNEKGRKAEEQEMHSGEVK